MKTKILKISFLILAFSLVIGAAVAIGTSANGIETTPEIISQNIEYSENFSLMYAVKADTVTNSANLKLYIYEEDPVSGNVLPARTYIQKKLVEAGNGNNLKYDSYIFTTDGISATSMAKVFYAQAVEGDKKSEALRYSVAEYLYQRLDSDDVTSAQLNFYNSTLEFGAAAQQAVSGETDETKYITNYCYVTVDGGTLNGSAYSKGLYPSGTVLTPTFADNSASWNVIYYYKNSYPAKISSSEAFTIKSGVKNVQFTTEDFYPYRKDVDNFNNRTAGTSYSLTYSGSASSGWKPNFADNIFTSSNGTSTLKYVSSADRGIVGNFPIQYGQRPVIINKDVYDPETDTAIEFSFDIKFESPKTLDTEEFQMWFINESNKSRTTTWYYKVRGDGADKNGLGTISDLNPREWFHIRFVIYKSDPTVCHIYVNGEHAHTRPSTFASISEVYGLAFTQYAKDSTGTATSDIYNVYFDNLYVGYTTDTLPAN